MPVSNAQNNTNLTAKNSLFKDYAWYRANFYNETIKAMQDFFKKDFELRFMGISIDENVFFYGDEYFVNKIPITKTGDFKVKISSKVIAHLLDVAIGTSEKSFELKSLTYIEAMLIKSFTLFLYRKLEKFLNKEEANKKQLQNAKEYSLTYYLRAENKHVGKIIISVPNYMLGEITTTPIKQVFSIDDFVNAEVKVKLMVGKSRIALNEIKMLEDGDVLVLENSDINEMAVVLGENEYGFRINPDPSLIISVDNNGGNEMEEETSAKSQNMWDSILVDIVAEFDNVKLTLGELKQISEGLVIDVGSVYDNKIKLRVENQVVATGELVILNDRYGVRIDSVKKSKETAKPAEKNAKPAPKPVKAATKSVKSAKAEAKAGDENFDYSDFEIEDESI